MQTISDSYRDQYATIHRENTNYGSSSGRLVRKTEQIARRYDCSTILDYGCGKAVISSKVCGVTNYDPAIPEYAEKPVPHDMVICFDVLEHIEPQYLEAVLRDLRRLTVDVGYFVVSTTKAIQILPDGRNAHLIVKPGDWWAETIDCHFTIKERFDNPSIAETHFIVE